MKVVLFCGGMGLRLRDYSELTPKPLVPIGDRPIMWHLMKYYAHFGHNDFIICLGWCGERIKQYFRDLTSCCTNHVNVLGSEADIERITNGSEDWSITFVDTGIHSSIGERLRRIRPFVEGEETFLANYADGLCNLHLPDLVDFHQSLKVTATFLAVRPKSAFHAVAADERGLVTGVESVHESGIWVNGGFFVMQPQIFRYLGEDDDLVPDALNRMAIEQQLACLRYEGYWSCMDTLKEKQCLTEMYERGDRPWQLWTHDQPGYRPFSVGANRVSV